MAGGWRRTGRDTMQCMVSRAGEGRSNCARRGQAVTTVIVWLLLGAIVNVAVAWGCALWSPVVAGASMSPADDETRLWTERLRSDLSETPVDPREEFLGEVHMYARRDRGFGYEVSTVSQVVVLPTARMRWREQAMSTIRAGWPSSALAGRRWERVSGFDRYVPVPLIGAPPPSTRPPPSVTVQWQTGAMEWTRPESLGGASFRVFPFRPVWPGFALNTVFYAGVLWLLFAAPFALRRWRRIKRGLCPKCGYPVGTSDKCTECGAAVITQKAETHKA